MELEKAARSPAAYHSPITDGKRLHEDDELEERVQRKEQPLIDRIIRGEEKGHYWLLLGPKGSGKTSMLIQAVGGPANSVAETGPADYFLRSWKKTQRE